MTDVKKQRDAFIAWMRKQEKNTGGAYSDNTITQYCDRLANAIPKLILSSVVKSNLFEYTFFDNFEDTIKVIRNSPNFSDINEKNGNGALSAALPLYQRFLQEQESLSVPAVAQSEGNDIFDWVPFYEALAYKLLAYKDKRHDLYELIVRLAETQPLMGYLHFNDRPEWWSSKEIDPFTIMGIINRGASDGNRIKLAKALADALGVTTTVPTQFTGIPVLNAQKSFFNGVSEMWDLFISAMEVAHDGVFTSSFKENFNKAVALSGNRWNITMGLYWVHPKIFMTLDSVTRQFLDNTYGIIVQPSGGGCCSADEYVSVLGEIKAKLKDENNSVHSFAELSYAAWISNGAASSQSSVPTLTVTKPRSNAHYWVYAPGRSAANWQSDIKDSEMSIGWEDLGDVAQYGSRDQVTAELEEWEDMTHSKAVYQSGVIWNFYDTISVGDVVYSRRGRSEIIGRGIVQGNYEYDENRGEHCSYRSVKWTHNGSWDYPGGLTAMAALQDITVRSDVVNQLEAVFEPANPSDKSYTKVNFLNEVYLSGEQYDILSGLIRRKKNIILQGAPGVGKTYVAKRLAYSIMLEKDDSRIRTVQFHQSYSYEDFILGYRPNENGFSLETGVFYDFCKTASADPDHDYYFIIDEVNRGNLSKIFGELLMLIEADKRGATHAVQLAYHSDELDRRFYVPENLYIIGMMNTADRSLATIDYALRRRFAFFTMLPNFNGIPSQSATLMKVIAEVEVINAELTKELGSGFQIGHSYFIDSDNAAVSDEELHLIVEFELIPLLEEYYIDDEPKFRSAVQKLRNALQ